MSEIAACPKCGRQLEARGVCSGPNGCGFSQVYGPLFKNERAEDLATTTMPEIEALRKVAEAAKAYRYAVDLSMTLKAEADVFAMLEHHEEELDKALSDAGYGG